MDKNYFIVIITVVASIITILTFVTGIPHLPELQKRVEILSTEQALEKKTEDQRKAEEVERQKKLWTENQRLETEKRKAELQQNGQQASRAAQAGSITRPVSHPTPPTPQTDISLGTVSLPAECPQENGLIRIRPYKPPCVIDYPKYAAHKEQIPNSAGPTAGTEMIVTDCSDPSNETVYRNFSHGQATGDYLPFLERVRSSCVIVRSIGTPADFSFNLSYR